MTPLTQIILLLLMSAIFLTALRVKALAWLAARPLMTLIGATLVGLGWTSLSMPELNSDVFRQLARYALGMMGFFAALQCRLSRLNRISSPTFRLSIFSPFIFLAIASVASFIIVPDLGLLPAVLVCAALMLGGAPSVATPLLTAPIEKETKAAARLESSTMFAATLPLALLVEAGATPAAPELWLEPIFRTFAAFAVGGTLGLLSGRFLPVSSAALPVMPFLVACATFGAGLYTGFDPVMSAVAGGILYSEEAPLKADVRTRLWRVAEGLITPAAFIGLGVLMAPLILNANLLIWLAAGVAVVAARAGGRFLALQRLTLSPQDRSFLIWYGGAPGAGTALFLIALVASPATLINDTALSLGVVATYLGLTLTRLQSRPLTSRLVQATARARRRRYSPA